MRPGICPLIASRRAGAEPARAARHGHHLTLRRQQVSSLEEWLSSSRLDVRSRFSAGQ